jgi:hypothetical protein
MVEGRSLLGIGGGDATILSAMRKANIKTIIPPDYKHLTIGL